ncbi:hypothetical protein N7466_002306 [Penicillium verhagenii]|uniref:uncharacterized protein n=1 Tax=Penicillium verhagenii TaxID=1562060 RepID=UPI0025452945|nr:uncharacterized protein N7466_002306 [Penicillium verhagenii]KAJ5939172.1 hypothetical protein N7466_002306 [Penicillium verhagenii]
MYSWKKLFHYSSDEGIEGRETSDHAAFSDISPTSVSATKRKRARVFSRLRRVKALNSTPVPAQTTIRDLSSDPRRTQGLRGYVNRVLRRYKSSDLEPSSETTSNLTSTDIPSSPPITFEELQREQKAIEEQAAHQWDLFTESPLLIPGTSSPAVSQSPTVTPCPLRLFAHPKDENLAICIDSLEATLNHRYPTIRTSSTESSLVIPAASSSTAPQSPTLPPCPLFRNSLGTLSSFVAQLKFESSKYTPFGQEDSSFLCSPSSIVVKFKDGNKIASNNPLHSTQTKSDSSSFLRSPPSAVAQFKDGNTIASNNSLHSTKNKSDSSSFLRSPPSAVAQLRDFRDENILVSPYSLPSTPQHRPSPIGNTTPPAPDSSSSFSKPLYITTQLQGETTPVVSTHIPDSISKYHLSPVGTFTAADMSRPRKRNSPASDSESASISKRPRLDMQHHLQNPFPKSTSSDHHYKVQKKRKRDYIEEICSPVTESSDEHTTSSESSHNLYSENSSSGVDSETESTNSQRQSKSHSSSPSARKRIKSNPVHLTDKRNQRNGSRGSRSVRIQPKNFTTQKYPRIRGVEESDDDEEAYVDTGQSDEDEYKITSSERNDLLYELTRERASRLAEAVEIPPGSGLSLVQVKLVRKLATRGCKPVMSRFWASDFTTWPESLFTIAGDGNIEDDSDLMFRSQEMSDNYAIKALQDLFAVSGRVRDCSFLLVEPQFFVGKTIRQYLHWAIDDAGLKTTRQTIPVHCICPQIPGEEIFATIMRCSQKLERLATRHQTAHDSDAKFWPTMLGFVIAGPIVCLLSLDTDPNSEVWSNHDSTGEESPAKFLTQFDLSEREQDVWNSLALAICVLHLRDTLIELTRVYDGSQVVPYYRGFGVETDDEDR